MVTPCVGIGRDSEINGDSDLNIESALIAKFETNAVFYANEIAVSDQEKTLTYEQLNVRSNKRRDQLAARGIKNGDGVAISLSHTCELVVSMLAVLKLGAYYIPIDLRNPPERTDYIIKDSEPKAKIYESSGRIKLSKLNRSKEERQSFNERRDPLAYVIYTSGTTGSPKGVGVTHKNIAQLLTDTESLFAFDHSDVWMLCHSFAFDFSVWEIWGALWHGAKLLVPNEITVLESSALAEYIISNGVTVLNQTPTAFKKLQEGLVVGSSCKLRYIIFGGERLNAKVYSDAFGFLKKSKVKIVNMYGITEVTVHATYHELTEQDLIGEGSNIGKVLPGFDYEILDRDGNQAEVGELYLSGLQVSKGYVFDSVKTKSRFVRLGWKRGVFYKSGDVVRRLSNGDLEYLGRNDNQVKIRGHRVELAEVEARLSSISGLSLTAVARVDNEVSGGDLACFYILQPGQEITRRELKVMARRLLPHYMVPTYFIAVKEIPHTVNGKVDRDFLVEKWSCK